METKKPISQKQPKPFKPKFNFYWIYLVLLLFFIGSLFWNPENIVREMSYSTFESVLRNGCVDKITVFANTNIVEAKIKPQCADSVFAEKFDKAANIPTAKVRILSADEFSKLIAKTADSAMIFKIEYNKLVEKALADLPIVTISQVDNVYKKVYDIRRELRNLQKEIGRASCRERV